MEEERKHSRLGGSKAERWMACPGSAWAEEHSTYNPYSGYADEGSAAHKVAELVMSGEKAMDEVLGMQIGNTIVTKEMRGHVQGYVHYLDSRTAPGDLVWLEHRLAFEQDVPRYPVAAEMFGSVDFLRFSATEKHLLSVDFKYGQGEYVRATDNVQLKYYAYSALLTLAVLGHFADTVEVGIYQPRIGDEPYRCEVFSAIDLMAWGETLMEAATATLPLDAPRHAGDHCHYCRAAPTCPTLMAQADAAHTLAEKLEDMPQPFEMRPEDLSLMLVKIVDFEEKFKKWALPFKSYATGLLERGTRIPGWKLTEKRAVRKFKPGCDAEIEEVLGDDAYEHSLVSPTQAEKILGKKAFAASPLAELVIKESSGFNLVPEASERPGVQDVRRLAADISFTAVEE